MAIKLKTPEEIKILEEGGSRHAEILSYLASIVAPGVSTFILEEEALRLIKEKGDKPAFLDYKPRGASRPFPAALCVSINNEIVHGIPNEVSRILKEGDIVSLDLGLVHKGMTTDAAVTVSVGQVNDEARKLLSVTEEALMAGIEQAKPGNYTGDIGSAISNVVKQTKFSLAEDLAGHGVGHSVHEEPFVPNFGKPGKGEELRPGLVIAIEPMVNVGKPGIEVTDDGYTIITRDGSLSAHFEHTVAITEEGNIVLTAVKG